MPCEGRLHNSDLQLRLTDIRACPTKVEVKWPEDEDHNGSTFSGKEISQDANGTVKFTISGFAPENKGPSACHITVNFPDGENDRFHLYGACTDNWQAFEQEPDDGPTTNLGCANGGSTCPL